MHSRYQLYQFILKMLKRLDWSGRRETQATLGYLMTGIFLAQDVRLSEIARKVPRGIKLENIVQRMRRFLQNERIDAQAIYAPVIRSVLDELRHTRLRVQIDRTLLNDRFNILMLTLRWRGRALPITWRVLSHQGSSGYAEWQAILAELEALLPPDAAVTILGDREFGHPDMLDLIQQRGWDAYLRVKGDQLIWDEASGEWSELRELGIEAGGETRCLQATVFTKKHHYRANFALTWDADEDEPLFIVTNQPATPKTVWEFGHRFGCEPFFSDWKQRGFNLENTRLIHTDRLERLLLPLALLTVWVLGVARRLKVSGGIHQLLRPSRIAYFSCFQIGLRWLDHQFSNGRSLIPDNRYRFWQLVPK